MVTNTSNPERRTCHDLDSKEFIELFDVAAFLWRARIFLLLGIVLGITTSAVLLDKKKPPAYVTSLAIRLETVGGINTEGVINNFSQFVERPELKTRLSDVEPVGGRMPFKLVSTGNALTLEVASLHADASGARALKSAEGLTAAAREMNNKILEAANAVVNNSDGEKQGSGFESQFAKLAAMQASEEAPLRAKLFGLEARLARRSGLRPVPSVVVQPGAAGGGMGLGDDVMRLFGALDGKLSGSERDAVLSEYADIVGRIRAVQAKYAQPLTEITAAMAALSDGILKAASGDVGLVPVVVVDKAAFAGAVAAGTHERYESKRVLFLALGVILGGILGLMAYGFLVFITENRERIRSIFRSSAPIIK
jgi:hypothetical protein